MIIDESLPSGWRLLDVDSAVGALHMQQSDKRLRLVVGVNQALPLAGSVTYRLVHESDDVPAWVAFDGMAKTVHGTRRSSVPVGGTQLFSLPLPPTNHELRITGLQVPAATPAQGLHLAFAMALNEGASDVLLAAEKELHPATVYVEYRSTLDDDTPWECIQTNALPDWNNASDEISLPARHGSGFYRLRVE